MSKIKFTEVNKSKANDEKKFDISFEEVKQDEKDVYVPDIGTSDPINEPKEVVEKRPLRYILMDIFKGVVIGMLILIAIALTQGTKLRDISNPPHKISEGIEVISKELGKQDITLQDAFDDTVCKSITIAVFHDKYPEVDLSEADVKQASYKADVDGTIIKFDCTITGTNEAEPYVIQYQYDIYEDTSSMYYDIKFLGDRMTNIDFDIN